MANWLFKEEPETYSFADLERAARIQAFGKRTGEMSGNVLHDRDAGQIAGQLCEHFAQRLGATCRRPEQNDPARMVIRGRLKRTQNRRARGGDRRFRRGLTGTRRRFRRR